MSYFVLGIDKQAGAGGGAVVECHRIVMDHFTVMSLVPSPLSESEAEIDLDLVPTSFLFL